VTGPKQAPTKGDVRDLARALSELGATVSETPDGLNVGVGGGPAVPVRAVARSVLSAGRAHDVARAVRAEGSGVPLVIADKIPGPARDVLTREGISWFDRRGHVRLHATGLLIDADVQPAMKAAPRRRFPTGRTGVGTAVALLIAASRSDDDGWAAVAPTVTGIAELAGVAVSGASTTMTTFQSLGYLNSDGSPVVPDLFWATTEHWTPAWVGLAEPIDADPRLVTELEANLDDLDALGWCLAGDAAAAAWHAPIVGGDLGARQWYVPSVDVLDTLRWTLGEAAPGERASSFVAVAPTPVICRTRSDPGVGVPVEPLVAAALDLARDQSRGHEILEQWEPERGQRVW
jgi:hypothetical protein